MNMKNLFATAMIAGLVAGSVAQADHHEEGTKTDTKAEAHACKGKNSCGGKKHVKKAKAKAKAKAAKVKAKAQAAAPAATTDTTAH